MGISQDLIIGKKTGRSYQGEAVGAKLALSAKIISYLDKASVLLNKGLAVIAGSSLILMMLTVVLNGIMRVISAPFYGTTEIVGFMCAITIAFSLGYTHLRNGYIAIDFLMDKFPHSVQKGFSCIMLLISTVFFALVSWQICVYALTVASNGNVSETMRITFYPLIFLVALGFAGLTLALFIDFLKQAGGAS